MDANAPKTHLLDVAKTPQQDVVDPGGLVKSQVVQSADGLSGQAVALKKRVDEFVQRVAAA